MPNGALNIQKVAASGWWVLSSKKTYGKPMPVTTISPINNQEWSNPMSFLKAFRRYTSVGFSATQS